MMPRFFVDATGYFETITDVDAPAGAVEVPKRPAPWWTWDGEAWVEGSPPPVTDTPLTAAQWRFALRRFDLLADVEAFAASLEGADRDAALIFEAQALHAGLYRFDQVLALVDAYRDAPGYPASLNLTEAQIAGMWAAVLQAMPFGGDTP